MNATTTDEAVRVHAVEAPAAHPVAVPSFAGPLAALPAVHPSLLLQKALESGASMELLERLMALQERHAANEARTAFNEALAAFKAKPLVVFKDKEVDFSTGKGRTNYVHATLGNVCKTIVAEMAKFGLSHTWELEQVDNGQIRVTCVLRHRLGHCERVSLQTSRDDSGSKNNIQAIGSAVTYLERYTLLAATGVATADMPDDDGAGSEREGIPRELLDGLYQTATDAAALAFWNDHKAQLAGDRRAYDDFKAAAIAHRTDLKGMAAQGAAA